MQNPDEIWQAEVNGEVYDTTFGELTVWIADSALLESDKVRRGNLRWLEAGRVPPLSPFFEAKVNGTEPPAVHVTVTDAADDSGAAPTASTHNINAELHLEGSPDDFENTETENTETSETQVETGTDKCNVHPDRESAFTCDACNHGFCKTCPQRYGSSVMVCPYCGGMCRPNKELRSTSETESRIHRDITEGFGFGDLGTAIAYPMRFKSSLFFGGLFVALLGYGQSAASMGSFFLIAAALICFILSTAIVFGMVSNTLNNFAKGEIDSNFMSGMDDFSAWDDIVHPFFLFVGAFISSFGIAAALIVGMAWYTFNSFSSQMADQTTQFTELAKESAHSAEHVNQVREKLLRQNEGRLNLDVGEDGLTDAQRSTIEEEAEFQRVNDLANNYRKNQLESTIGKTPETQRAELNAFMKNFAQTAGIFILLIGIALLWGFFYFPAACAVAGYTRSFGAAVNPLVGLDTIKHLGFDYAKILSMNFLLLLISGFINMILAIVFSPFDLPTFGNIPANFAASFIGFYFSVVFAVLLGLALYKNSDKLKLYR